MGKQSCVIILLQTGVIGKLFLEWPRPLAWGKGVGFHLIRPQAGSLCHCLFGIHGTLTLRPKG